MSEGFWGGIIQDYAIYLAAVSAIISSLIVVYRKAIKPMLKAVTHYYAAIEKIDKIFEEMRPNGGTSIKDKIDRIDHGLTFVGERLRAYLADADEAHFETDADGNCTRVNRTYTRLVERETSEILGHGWHNCVYQKDREHVTSAWYDAVDDDRELSLNFRFETPSGKIIPVKGVSYKMTNDEGVVIGYLGKIRILKDNTIHNI